MLKPHNRARPQILIIGSGIAGILMGIRLLACGFDNFIILEKAETLGGTWRDKRYPGLACDVPAHLYVYSFRPNPDWKSHFAAGQDIWRYYDRVAREHGVDRHMRFGQEVVSAKWEENRWTVRTAAGDVFRADVVVSAVGRLHHPAYPDIPGLDDFSGRTFHTARWPDVSLTGEKVGIVGTGSTATQLTAALADQVEKLTIFQRTPQWVLSVPNPRISWWRRSMFRLFPSTLRNYVNRLERELRAMVESVTGSDHSALRSACEASLELIRDPALRAKMRPEYEPGCKRLIISPDFHHAVQRPNVRLVTSNIAHAEATGVRTTDGRLHELDTLILATGFKADAYMRPMTIEGVDGISLDEIWAQVPLNYRSVALPGMPNFFMINGPYSPGGSASVVAIIEVHVNYVLQLIERVFETKQALMPKHGLSEDMLAEIRDAARRTVWATGGCRSWYLDRYGVPL